MYAHSSPPTGKTQTQSTQLTPSTEVVAQLDVSDSAWYLDTGANHHLTSNASLLYNAQPYTRQDQVTLGNDRFVPITQSEFSVLVMPLF